MTSPSAGRGQTRPCDDVLAGAIRDLLEYGNWDDDPSNISQRAAWAIVWAFVGENTAPERQTPVDDARASSGNLQPMSDPYVRNAANANSGGRLMANTEALDVVIRAKIDDPLGWDDICAMGLEATSHTLNGTPWKITGGPSVVLKDADRETLHLRYETDKPRWRVTDVEPPTSASTRRLREALRADLDALRAGIQAALDDFDRECDGQAIASLRSLLSDCHLAETEPVRFEPDPDWIGKPPRP